MILAGALALGFAALAGARAQTPAYDPRQEKIEELPPRHGREETFGVCTACHGFKLVSSQGMSRAQWDDTLTWMTARHRMPEVQGANRDLSLDYLAQHYPPRAPSRAGGFRNPFAPQ